MESVLMGRGRKTFFSFNIVSFETDQQQLPFLEIADLGGSGSQQEAAVLGVELKDTLLMIDLLNGRGDRVPIGALGLYCPRWLATGMF
jgi:hypothetical protein